MLGVYHSEYVLLWYFWNAVNDATIYRAVVYEGRGHKSCTAGANATYKGTLQGYIQGSIDAFCMRSFSFLSSTHSLLCRLQPFI